MVHRSGSTLIIAPNDGENSQNLPQFLDGLDPCTETTENKSKKSLTLPTKHSSFELTTRRRRTNAAPNTKALNKAINKSKQQQQQQQQIKGSSSSSNNIETINDHYNNKNDNDNGNIKILKDSSTPLQNKIRSGLRSNSLENIVVSLNDNDDGITTIAQRLRGGQRIRKRRKNLNTKSTKTAAARILRKCVSVESVFINTIAENDDNDDIELDNDDDDTKEDEQEQQEQEHEQELPFKLTCSVPLDKLTGILDSILITHRQRLSQPNLTEISKYDEDDDLDNDHDEKKSTLQPPQASSSSSASTSSTSFDDGNSSISSNSHIESGGGHSSQLIKSLCLYCDKKFSSQKVRIKHTERVHAVIRGRRLSSRNNSLSSSLSCPSNLSSYPGCSYCCYNNSIGINSNNNSNNSNSNNSNNKLNYAISDDLKSLFHHLIDVHSDKYFACKICAIRFLNADDLHEHNAIKHKIDTIKRGNPMQIGIKTTTTTMTTTTTTTTTATTTISSMAAPTTTSPMNIITSSIMATTTTTSATNSTPSSTSSSAASAVVATKSTKSKNASLDVNSDLKAVQPLQIEIENNDRNQISNEKEDENTYDPESTPTKTRRQIKQAMENKQLVITRSCQNLLRSDETILSRLGITQNRLPRSRKGVRNRRLVAMDTIKTDTIQTSTVKTRSKVGRVMTSNVIDVPDQIATIIRPPTSSRIEPLCCTFDDDFYETVSLNVRQNLSCHIDGKLDGDPTSPSPLSPVTTVPTIRSTVVKSPLNHDSEIHEATTLSTVTAFPTLLTAEQYGSDLVGAAKIKRPITKHSWKWKWDCVKKYKYVNEGGKIVKKVKHPIIGLRDLSKLDMWTQLTMRTKHEMARKQLNEISGQNETLAIGETVREEKRKQIAQLNTILDTRRLPQIVLEQSEQTFIKIEVAEDSNPGGELFSSLYASESMMSTMTSAEEYHVGNDDHDNDENSLPRLLNLCRRKSTDSNSQRNVVLSGEWARPRCYICFGCGAKFDKLKSLEEHKMFRHPYVYSTHYEIVGRELIEGDLYKHFYIPTKALNRHKEYKLHMRKQTSTATTTSIGEDDTTKIGIATITTTTVASSSSLLSAIATATENSTCGEESMDSVNSVPVSNYTTGTSRSDYEIESKAIYTSSVSTKSSTSSTVSTSVEIEEESTTVSAVVTAATSLNNTTVNTLSNNNNITSSHFSGKCTKCKRECGGLLELYRHMLDCSGDYAWFMAKKRKYRYFGSKKRRRDQLRHNARLALQHRKQAAAASINKNLNNENNSDCISKDETESNKSIISAKAASSSSPAAATTTTLSSSPSSSSSANQQLQHQKKKNSPPTPRPPRPSDAESIRRMLENLPAKRACRQIIPNVTKPRVVKKLGINKKGILLKKGIKGGGSGGVGCSTKSTLKAATKSKNGNKNVVTKSTVTTIANNIRNRQKQIYTRRLRQLRSTTTIATASSTLIKTRTTATANKNNKKSSTSSETTTEKSSNKNSSSTINDNNNAKEKSTIESPTTATATTTTIKRSQQNSNSNKNENDSSSISNAIGLLAATVAGNTNENVVKKLSKKTKCLVEKITHNIQKNKKTLLNKKCAKNEISNDNTPSSSSSSSSSACTSEMKSKNVTTNGSNNSKSTEENSSKNKNENSKESKNSEETNVKKKSNDKPIITILEAKKMKKTRALIRRLSFHKTTRQTITVMTATTPSSSSVTTTSVATTSSSTSTKTETTSSSSSPSSSKPNENDTINSVNNGSTSKSKEKETQNSSTSSNSKASDSKEIEKSESNNDKKLTPTNGNNSSNSGSSSKSNKNDKEEISTSSVVTPSKKSTTKKSIRKIINRFKDKNKKSPKHETEQLDIANENERTDNNEKERQESKQGEEEGGGGGGDGDEEKETTAKISSTSDKESLIENSKNQDDSKDNATTVSDDELCNVPLKIDVPSQEQQQQTLLNVPSQSNSSNNNQISPSSKRRSKKLNDCIAMLTGKLEEKLGKSFFESNENLDVALSRQSSTTDLNQEQQSTTAISIASETDSAKQSTEDLVGATNITNTAVESSSLPSSPEKAGKQQPKRKTKSRKVLKKDDATPVTEIPTVTVCDVTDNEKIKNSPLPSPSLMNSHSNLCLADLTESVIRKSLNSDSKISKDSFSISCNEMISCSSSMVPNQQDLVNTPRRLRSETHKETTSSSTSPSNDAKYHIQHNTVPSIMTIPATIAETTISLVPALPSKQQITADINKTTTTKRSNTITNRRASVTVTTFTTSQQNPFPFPTPENSLSCSSNLDFDDKNLEILSHSTPKDNKKTVPMRSTRRKNSVPPCAINDSVGSEGSSITSESFDVVMLSTTAAAKKRGDNDGRNGNIVTTDQKTPNNENHPEISLNLITPEKETELPVFPDVSNSNKPVIFPLQFKNASESSATTRRNNSATEIDTLPIPSASSVVSQSPNLNTYPIIPAAVTVVSAITTTTTTTKPIEIIPKPPVSQSLTNFSVEKMLSTSFPSTPDNNLSSTLPLITTRGAKKKNVYIRPKKISSDDSILDSINAVISQSCSDLDSSNKFENKIVIPDTLKQITTATSIASITNLSQKLCTVENKREISVNDCDSRIFKGTNLIPPPCSTATLSVLPILQDPSKNLTALPPPPLSVSTTTLPPPPPPFLTGVLNPLNFPPPPTLPSHQLNIPQNITAQMIEAAAAAGVKRGRRQSIASSKVPQHLQDSLLSSTAAATAVDLRTYNNMMVRMNDYGDDNEGPIDLSTKPKKKNDDSIENDMHKTSFSNSDPVGRNPLINSGKTSYSGKKSLYSFDLPKPSEQSNSLVNVNRNKNTLQPQHQESNIQLPSKAIETIPPPTLPPIPSQPIVVPSEISSQIITTESSTPSSQPSQPPKKKFTGRQNKRKNNKSDESKDDELQSNTEKINNIPDTTSTSNTKEIDSKDVPKTNKDTVPEELQTEKSSIDTTKTQDKIEIVVSNPSETVENPSINSIPSTTTDVKKKRGSIRKKKDTTTCVSATTKETHEDDNKNNDEKLQKSSVEAGNQMTNITNQSTNTPEATQEVIDTSLSTFSGTRKYTRKTKAEQKSVAAATNLKENVPNDTKEMQSTKLLATENDKTSLEGPITDPEVTTKKEDNVPIKKSRRTTKSNVIKSCLSSNSHSLVVGVTENSTPDNQIEKQSKEMKSVTFDEDNITKQEQEQQPKRRVTRSKSMAMFTSVLPSPPSSSLRSSVRSKKEKQQPQQQQQEQQQQNKNLSEVELIVKSFLSTDANSNDNEGLEYAKIRATDGPIRLDELEKVFGKCDVDEYDDSFELLRRDEGFIDDHHHISCENSIDDTTIDGKSLNTSENSSKNSSETTIEPAESSEKSSLLSSSSSLVSSVCQELSISLVKIDEIYNISKEQSINIQDDGDEKINKVENHVSPPVPPIPPVPPSEPPKRERSKRIANRRGTIVTATATTTTSNDSPKTDVSKVTTVTEPEMSKDEISPSKIGTVNTTAKKRGRKRLGQDSKSISKQNSIETVVDSTNTISENSQNSTQSTKLIEKDENTTSSVVDKKVSTIDSKENSINTGIATGTNTIAPEIQDTKDSNSEPLTTAAATTTTNTSTTTVTTATGTKQRRRRRNELAAIVADQLLESFKEVDKSRIDDLKMLENLAYEKSEDLFITGMRLTPTTKRKTLQEKNNEKDTNKDVTEKPTKVEDNLKKTKSKRGNNKNQSLKSKSTSDIPSMNSDTEAEKSKEKEKNSTAAPLSSTTATEIVVETTKTAAAATTTTATGGLKKRKTTTNSIKVENKSRRAESPSPSSSISSFSSNVTNNHENLFRTFATKQHDEPLKLNVEPLPQNMNFKICSNFNTTQFDIFSTFKSSFDTFRSLTDSSFMRSSRENNGHSTSSSLSSSGHKRMTHHQKQNFIPGSTETSNSSQSQQSPNQNSRLIGLQDDNCSANNGNGGGGGSGQNNNKSMTTVNETSSSNEKKSTSHKKSKKKINKKKSGGNVISSSCSKLNEIENINELRNGLESFTFGQKSPIIRSSSFTNIGNFFDKNTNKGSFSSSVITPSSISKTFMPTVTTTATTINKSSPTSSLSLKSPIFGSAHHQQLTSNLISPIAAAAATTTITIPSTSVFNFSSFSNFTAGSEKETIVDVNSSSSKTNKKLLLLRPSILSNVSATETTIKSTTTTTAITNKQDVPIATVPLQSSSAAAPEIIKPISSRDPRLNKNKHQKKELETTMNPQISIPSSATTALPPLRPIIERGRSSFAIRQRRKSEITPSSSQNFCNEIADNNEIESPFKGNRLRSSRRLRDARLNSEKSSVMLPLKPTPLRTNANIDLSDGNAADNDDDDEDDTYLNQIAKSVKDKMMTTEEQEDFSEVNDGFNIENPDAAVLLEQPPRPATSMGLSSIRSSLSFVNDDQSRADEFGHDDDDNTNTELIDMDLDDDISVYTSFSQDVSRLRNKGRFGGRRRRRKSILLSRRSKKTLNSDLQSNETFDCTICNKTFKKSIALAKHKMTLTHIAKLSEYEYITATREREKQEQLEREQQRRQLEEEEERQRQLQLEKQQEINNEEQEQDEEQEEQELIAAVPCDNLDDESISSHDQSEDENSVQIISPPCHDEIDNLASSSDKESDLGGDVDNRFNNLEFEQAEPEPSATPLEAEPPRLVGMHVPSRPIISAAEKPISSSSMNLLNQSGIEPISSPEQMETNYDRYQNTSSRIALSQEERLFYECCNMLKGGETPLVERSYPMIPNSYSAYDVPNKPVTPKSSERFSYLGSDVSGNFQHGTAYTVKSPMSQSRSSPRHAYPKIDINQFSDISSDSNPTIPIHRTQPNHPPLMSSSTNFNGGGAKGSSIVPSTFNQQTSAFHHHHHHHHHHHDLPPQNLQSGQSRARGMSPLYASPDAHAFPSNRNNYSGNNAMYYGNSGNNFAPSQFASMRNENDVGQLSARTYVGGDRGRENSAMSHPASSYPPDVGAAATTIDKPTCIAGVNRTPQSFTSPVHSTSSQGSTVTTTSRMRTKAAMKGYDNFKVSIPTLGLDMQQALERSPHGGCKLTALAEIALGSEAPAPPSTSAPVVPEHFKPFQQQQQLRREEENTAVVGGGDGCSDGNVINDKLLKPKPSDINEKFAKKYHELIMNNIKENKKRDSLALGGKISPTTKATKKRYDDKFHKISSSLSPQKIIIPEKPKDIYDFDDESDDKDIEAVEEECAASSPIRSQNENSNVEEKIIIPERPFKDIGLNEQQIIKFHKPDEIIKRTPSPILQQPTIIDENHELNQGTIGLINENNQNEESLMSSTSYSDRDDGLNYGSMSENDDDDSDKDENETTDIKINKNIEDDDDDDDDDDNSDDSQSSARTAKTIREKSLIMGRIFKNANKTFSRVEEKGQETILIADPPQQKKKLEAQQKELDKLFDSLRKEPVTTEITPTNRPTNGINTSSNSARLSNSVDKIQESPDVHQQTSNAITVADSAPVATNAKKRTTKKATKTTTENKEENNFELGNVHVQKPSSNNDQNNITVGSEKNVETSTAKVSTTETATKGRKRGRKNDSQLQQQRKQKQQHSKEIHKLQAELGMSAEEIAELLGEGKRKSQRRCAANRPKKVVEIWSSDEYEEFLSTKDIIALIEEKEKKSKKRKSSSQTATTTPKSTAAIEKKKSSGSGDTNHVLMETQSQQSTTVTATLDKKPQINDKLKSSAGIKRTKSVVNDDEDECKTLNKLEDGETNRREMSRESSPSRPKKNPEKIVDRLLEKLSQANNGTTGSITSDQDENKPLSQVLTESKTNNKSTARTTSVEAEQQHHHHTPGNTSTKRPREKNTTTTAQEKKSQRKPTLSVKPRVKSHTANAADSESDFESEWRRGTFEAKRAKIKKRRKTISFKEAPNPKKSTNSGSTMKSSLTAATTETTTTTTTSKSKPTLSGNGNSQKNLNRNENKETTATTITTTTKVANDDGEANGENNTTTRRPLPRRKRVASEMLYYWSSSSSDEEFGRIEARDDDDDDLTDGEHYQQHGWIVGDSHKKLVTLLAIAKGKKAEDCGVKETVSKKKS